MNLTTATPVEIDTILYDLYRKELAALLHWQATRDRIHVEADDKKRDLGRRRVWTMTYDEAHQKLLDLAKTSPNAQTALDNLIKAEQAVNDIRTQQNPYRAEFNRRGGWHRAFLAIVNGKGHVHSSEECSSCHKGIDRTQFSWMVRWSGASEEKIVHDAGERACTICYPSAPVQDLRRPTKMFSEEEITAQQAREERIKAQQAREAAKAAKAITAPDGSRLHGKGTYDWIDTEAEAQRQAVDALSDILWNEHVDRVLEADPDMTFHFWPADKREERNGENAAFAMRIMQALAAKRGEPMALVHEQLRKKAVAKHRRSWREAIETPRWRRYDAAVAYEKAKTAKGETPWEALTIK